MAKLTPMVRGDTLVYQQQGQEQALAVGSPAWYTWLATASTFAYTGDGGTFTARKERAGNQRGGWYWKAYRTHHGAHSSCYLGKSDALTLDCLTAAATRLGRASAGAAQEEPRAQTSPPAPSHHRDDPLLATKLHVPRPPAQLVRRARLTTRLQEVLERALTLIAAPAGFGKTTLLAAWLPEAPVASAWVSLDGGDDDPVRFWSYTLAALDGVCPEGGLSALGLPLLCSPQPPPLDTILTAIINRLAALPAPVVLVFDDYHAITAPPIHTSLTFLLDHLPAALHLVIATRADPPLPLARLRARGQLGEIRAADLRFTREETAAFLAQRGAPALAPQEIAALEARTEGWIAALQLAALSLQGRQESTTFLQAFTGSHRFVVDYLTQEVLARQPAGVQRFLLETSLLERLCGPLCEAVTGEPAGQAMLERLDATNLFLVPLDEDRHWYRYHHLFAEMLRQRLQGLAPESVAPLHRRAGAWYAEQNLLSDAVHHALAAGDAEEAARLVEQAADLMTKRGEIATLRAWLEALPADLVRSRVELSLRHSWLLAQDGQFEAAERLLQHVERLLGADTAVALPASAAEPPRPRDGAFAPVARAGRVASIRALMAFKRGDAPGTIALARQALEQLPADTAARGLLAWMLGIASLLNGDLEAGAAALTEARAISLAAGNSYAAVMATFELAHLHANQGHLHRAGQAYRQALDLVAGARGEQPAAAGPAYVGLGDLQREWNNLDLAARSLHDGIAGCRQTGNGVILLLGCVALARVRQAQGDAEGAHALIQQIDQERHTQQLLPHNAAQLAAWHARLSLQQGDLATAWRWAQQRGLRVEDEPRSPLEVESLTWARVLLAQGRPAEAAAVLARLLRLAERHGRMGHAVAVLVLQALAQQARGDPVGALAPLARALSLAEPEGYIRLFVDEGAPLARLLAQLRLRQPGPRQGSTRYWDHLLALLGHAPDADALPGGAAAPASGLPLLGDPLSDRELEVLRLIATGCSNRAIAGRLVLEVSTVKWYVHTIYGKLQVESRTQAIARAHDLHLV